MLIFLSSGSGSLETTLLLLLLFLECLFLASAMNLLFCPLFLALADDVVESFSDWPYLLFALDERFVSFTELSTYSDLYGEF